MVEPHPANNYAFTNKKSVTLESARAINVEEAPAATPEPTPPPASIADMYFVPATIGILIAIVLAVLVIWLMLRKRP